MPSLVVKLSTTTANDDVSAVKRGSTAAVPVVYEARDAAADRPCR